MFSVYQHIITLTYSYYLDNYPGLHRPLAPWVLFNLNSIKLRLDTCLCLHFHPGHLLSVLHSPVDLTPVAALAAAASGV